MQDAAEKEGAGKIISRLEAALSTDGDFPARARVINELLTLANNPDTPLERIVELVLSEPALGTRILHIVNSVFYQGATPVITVSQAVVRLGMSALAELCSSLVLLQRFSPAARRGGIFADNVKKCILTSLLTTALAFEMGDKDAERGHLSGSFFSIGPLLLAYYFPQVFESAQQRALKRGKPVTQSITETLGVPPAALSLAVIDRLAIPQFYREVLVSALALYTEESSRSSVTGEHSNLSAAVAAAGRMSEAIIESTSRKELAQALENVAVLLGLGLDQITAVTALVPESFRQHCKVIDMSFLELPQHFLEYAETPNQEEGDVSAESAAVSTQFAYYVDEIREAIKNGETMSSIITSAMEALSFGLKFDRVLLLFSDPISGKLIGKMSLGESFGSDPASIVRELDDSAQKRGPDAAAFVNASVETYGEPLFAGCWPFAAVPIGTKENSIGVLYADRLAPSGAEALPLTDGVHVALNMLADLLDKALAANE